jgi:hypothetical protein
MRACIALIFAALTAACASSPVALNQGPIDSGFGRIASRLFNGGQPPAQSPQFRALLATTAPAIVVSVEERDAATGFLRQTSRDGVETWISPDNVALYLQAGFLVGTRGLGGDMMSADIGQSAALVLGRGTGQVERFMSFLDGNDQVTIRSYVCDIESRGGREIATPTGQAQTVLMQERCTNPTQEFQNLYWVSAATGEIVQSRQWAGDFSGPLAIRRAER